MSQKQIRLCIAKIFNYHQSSKVVPLLIQFYSKKTQSIIARKPIKASLLNNYLQINIHLKIKFIQTQNQMIISIQKTDQQGKYLQNIGEVQINMEEVMLRKIKYYTIGDEKVLQVQVSNQNAKQTLNNQHGNANSNLKKRNQKFLQDRRKFLQNVNHTQKMLKRTFSEKIMSLLSQTNNNDTQQQQQQQGQGQSNHPPTQQQYRNNNVDYQSIKSGYMNVSNNSNNNNTMNMNNMNNLNNINTMNSRKMMKSTSSEYGVRFTNTHPNAMNNNNNGNNNQRISPKRQYKQDGNTNSMNPKQKYTNNNNNNAYTIDNVNINKNVNIPNNKEKKNKLILNTLSIVPDGTRKQ